MKQRRHRFYTDLLGIALASWALYAIAMQAMFCPTLTPQQLFMHWLDAMMFSFIICP